MAKKKLPKPSAVKSGFVFTRTPDGMIGLEIKINILPTSALNSRQNWHARHKETKFWDLILKEACLTFQAVHKNEYVFPLQQAQLILIRSSSHRMDWDNLAASWKHPVDSLVSNGLLKDDSWDVIGMPFIDWEKCSPGHGSIKIVLTAK